MSIEKAKAYLRQFGAEDRVIEFPVSSATVELAAEAAHCEPARIAKTLSFRTNDGVILIVAAGDTKICLLYTSSRTRSSSRRPCVRTRPSLSISPAAAIRTARRSHATAARIFTSD